MGEKKVFSVHLRETSTQASLCGWRLQDIGSCLQMNFFEIKS